MKDDGFWEDLDASAADLVRDTILGENVEKLAQALGKSPDLLYKAANPTTIQQLNLKQFLALLQKTKNYRALKRLSAACGFLLIPINTNTLEGLKALVKALEGMP
jgi:hypothetical protein